MTYRLHVTRDAFQDLKEAAQWYDDQDPGTGQQFLIAIQHRFEHIQQSPLLSRTIGTSAARRWLVSRWPYSIYYRVIQDQIRIIAVVHNARDPKYLNYRLR